MNCSGLSFSGSAAPVGWIGGWSVVSFLPRVGVSAPLASRRCGVLVIGGTVSSVARMPLRSRLGGYTVLSTRGYEIRPFIYSDSAMRIVRAGVRPSEAGSRHAATVVLNGAGGLTVRLVRLDCRRPCPCSRPATASIDRGAASSALNRSVACVRRELLAHPWRTCP